MLYVPQGMAHGFQALTDQAEVSYYVSEFYSPDEVRVWLNSRNELLDGRRAIDLIHDGQTETVLEAIGRLATCPTCDGLSVMPLCA